jgi:putative ABC transport system substrate-binding protein
MFRRVALLLIAASLTAPLGCGKRAPQEVKLPQVTIFNLLSHPILDSSIKGIKEGLADSGYPAGRVRIVEMSANGEMDKLNAFAKEALSARPTVIVPVSTPVAQAVVKEASPDQSVVFSTVTNPSDVGMDARPRNLTGVSDAVNYEANLDLIAELFPKARRIGIIYNPGERNSEFGISEVRTLAKTRPIALEIVPVSRSEQVADATRSLVGRVDVIYIGSDNTVVGAIAGVLKVAQENRIPVIASDAGSVDQGALAAVSVDYEKLGRKVGEMVADLLKTGRHAGDIPNVVFHGDALILNQKSAAAIAFSFPPSILARASRVVE